jgi:hypothetical protein
MTVTNNYLNKQELVSQKVQGSVSTGIQGFDSNMNPVFAAKIATSAITNSADYVRKTFGDIFVAKELDGNATTIRYSADKSKGYLVDKQGEKAASWRWDSLNIEVPETIRPAMDIVKSLLAPVKKLVELIREAIHIAASLVTGLSEALRVLIEEVLNVLIAALEWFNIEVNVHILFVPPIVPVPVKKDLKTNIDISKTIVDGASSAIKDLNPKLFEKFKLAVTETSVAGNVGFYNKVLSKINDSTDINRPQFRDNNYIAGCTLVAGYPIEAIYNIYERIIALFKKAPRPTIHFLPKNYSIKSVHYIKNLNLISFDIDITNTQRICLFEEPTVVETRAMTYLAVYNKDLTKVSKSDIRLLTSELDKAISKEGLRFDEVADSVYEFSYIMDLSENDQLAVIVGSELTDSNPGIMDFSTQGSIKMLSGESYEFKMYTFKEYIFTDSNGKKETKLICLNGNRGTITVPIYGKFQISTGSGKTPNWVQISSMFDLFEFLGEVRDTLGLIRKYVNSIFSKFNQMFKKIIDALDRYINFILTILAKIDTLLDILKDLAGLGVGASMLFFHGEGGNTTLKKILKDAFIDMPNKLYNDSPKDYSRPELGDMSLAHSNWNSSKKQIAKYYARAGQQLSELLANTKQDMAGSFPPNFNKDESVTGMVMVGGGDSLDNVMKLYNLLVGLFGSSQVSSDSDEEFKADVEAGVGKDVSSISPNQALQSIFGAAVASDTYIPGAYTSDLLPTSNPDSMLEDYCIK